MSEVVRNATDGQRPTILTLVLGGNNLGQPANEHGAANHVEERSVRPATQATRCDGRRCRRHNGLETRHRWLIDVALFFFDVVVAHIGKGIVINDEHGFCEWAGHARARLVLV